MDPDRHDDPPVHRYAADARRADAWHAPVDEAGYADNSEDRSGLALAGPSSPASSHPCGRPTSRGAWRGYYQRWDEFTRQRLDPRYIALLPTRASTSGSSGTAALRRAASAQASERWPPRRPEAEVDVAIQAEGGRAAVLPRRRPNGSWANPLKLFISTHGAEIQ